MTFGVLHTISLIITAMLILMPFGLLLIKACITSSSTKAPVRLDAAVEADGHSPGAMPYKVGLGDAFPSVHLIDVTLLAAIHDSVAFENGFA